jgi:hypothetical protein
MGFRPVDRLSVLLPRERPRKPEPWEPDVEFPPAGTVQPGYITHITVDRITGVGPWAP